MMATRLHLVQQLDQQRGSDPVSLSYVEDNSPGVVTMAYVWVCIACVLGIALVLSLIPR